MINCKQIFLFAFLLVAIISSCKKESTVTEKTISVDTAGQLVSLISEDEMLTITKLSISGPINGSDIRVIRIMAKDGSLQILDLSNAAIVAGGKPYYVDEVEVNKYYSSDNIVSTRMFSSCYKLQSIDLPKTVTGIGDEAFAYSSQLSSVIFHENLDSIGERVFYKTNLTGEINLPSSLRTISRQAFAYTNITKVVINSDIIAPKSSNVYAIGGNSVFAECKKLNELVVKEGCSILEIGFEGCESLTSVLLPNTLTDLGALSRSSGNYIFAYCTSLKTISLPSNLKYIGNKCFGYCGIDEITIPKSVERIDSYAFCDLELKKMIVSWDKPLSVASSIFSKTSLEDATLYVPSGTKNLYQNKAPWNSFGSIIEQ